MKGAYTSGSWHLEEVDGTMGSRIMAGNRCLGIIEVYPQATALENLANAKVMVVAAELLEILDKLLIAVDGNLPEEFQSLIDDAQGLSNHAKGI